MSNKNIRLLYIDLFCGGGGTSTGVERAKVDGKKCCKVVLCINHDKNAILSHSANHKHVKHCTEDIRTVALEPLVEHVNRMRKRYPNAKLVIWASLECTNFSKAKGGLPRDADSRTLAESLYRYIEAFDPDYLQIENVREFMSWGDLDEHGKPVSKDKGRCYMDWVRTVKSYGYKYDYEILNAADFGAYTTRTRYFGVFARQGMPLVFPEPTHSKYGEHDMFKHLKKWRAVKDVLDFEVKGVSIFRRKKPLSEKTLERIYAGLIRYVAGGREAFIVKWNSMSKSGKYTPPSIDEPCPTVTTQNRLGLAEVAFLSKQFSGHPDSKNVGVDSPAGTITTVDHHALVEARFLSAYYGTGVNATSVDSPAPTVTTKDRLSLVTPRFLDQQYGNGKPASVEKPAGTITAVPKMNLVECVPMAYLVNPQYNSEGTSIDKPCFTLIARMDKKPPYLVVTERGEIAIEIYETDSPMTRKIKEFMAMYGLSDVLMRMLIMPELKRIMGFPSEYILVGPQKDQKKFIGNAVETTMARVMAECIAQQLWKKVKLAA